MVRLASSGVDTFVEINAFAMFAQGTTCHRIFEININFLSCVYGDKYGIINLMINISRRNIFFRTDSSLSLKANMEEPRHWQLAKLTCKPRF